MHAIAGPGRALSDTPTDTREDTLLDVLDRAVGAVRSAGVPFLVIGEIASSRWGRDRGTGDVDLFVRPELVSRVLSLLEAEGFETRVVYEHWLSKATVSGVDVDVIFRASRDILLDD